MESPTVLEFVALPNGDSLSNLVGIIVAKLGLGLPDFVKVENFGRIYSHVLYTISF